jgi:hypothetical protein
VSRGRSWSESPNSSQIVQYHCLEMLDAELNPAKAANYRCRHV